MRVRCHILTWCFLIKWQLLQKICRKNQNICIFMISCLSTMLPCIGLYHRGFCINLCGQISSAPSLAYLPPPQQFPSAIHTNRLLISNITLLDYVRSYEDVQIMSQGEVFFNKFPSEISYVSYHF